MTNGKYITTSFEETQALGREFADTLQGGAVLALSGDLGSGKTTFVQGLAKGLGITNRIISPTFIIMRTYEITNGRIKRFYHVDLYRIESERDIESLGLLEMMQDPESVVVIEWPEKLKDFLPQAAQKIAFRYREDETREIHF